MLISEERTKIKMTNKDQILDEFIEKMRLARKVEIKQKNQRKFNWKKFGKDFVLTTIVFLGILAPFITAIVFWCRNIDYPESFAFIFSCVILGLYYLFGIVVGIIFLIDGTKKAIQKIKENYFLITEEGST